jgi:hypothetical protein
LNPIAPPIKRARAMTVRTDDIALRDLREDPLRSGSPDHPGDSGFLELGRPMVEIHRARWKRRSTVGTGNGAQLIEKASLRSPSAATRLDVPRGSR